MNAYNVYKHGNHCASVKMSQTIVVVVVKHIIGEVEFNSENSKDIQKRPDFRTAIY